MAWCSVDLSLWEGFSQFWVLILYIEKLLLKSSFAFKGCEISASESTRLYVEHPQMEGIVFHPLQESFLIAKICFCKVSLLYLQHVWEKELCPIRKELILWQMRSGRMLMSLVYLPLCGPAYIKRKLAFSTASCRESASNGQSSSPVSKPAWKCFHLSN